MKKFIALILTITALSTSAHAESIVVIDQNGTVIRQMFTSPTTFTEPVASTTTYTAPQTITVVRESPVVQNSYYYDRPSTNAALAAGVTTAVIGGLLFDGFRIGHHHHHHHGGGHHGGRHHR